MERRKFLKVAAVTSTAATASACFGSFPAVRWVYSFNKEISSSKLIQWLVFLLLNFIPVYSVAAFIDVWILNSLEFWFGGSEVSGSEDEKEKVVELSPGETVTMTKDVERGIMEMQYEGRGKSASLRIEMHEDGARLVTGNGRRIGRVAPTEDGEVEVYAGGRLLTRYDAEQVSELTRTWQQGGSQAVASWAADHAASTPTVAGR